MKGLVLRVEVFVFNSMESRRSQGVSEQVTAMIRRGHLGSYFPQIYLLGLERIQRTGFQAV